MDNPVVTDADREALLPCPFCGGTDIRWFPGSNFVGCFNCMARTATDFTDTARQDCIAAWNTRTQATAEDRELIAELVEGLESLLPDFTGGIDPTEPEAVMKARALIAKAKDNKS